MNKKIGLKDNNYLSTEYIIHGRKKLSDILDKKDVYSTEETKTNKIWKDGKPIYRKVFYGITLSTGAGKVAANVLDLNIDAIIKLQGTVYDTNNNQIKKTNFWFTTSDFFTMLYSKNNRTIIYDNGSTVGCLDIILEYTKTTD